jgi:glycosyltransferase involved in cell wall biosynthesis
MSTRVRFQSSPPEDVPDAYAAADAVVFPVRWQEPWGLVPLEAMAVGRPVVASSAGGGAAEYLHDEHNCLQFAPGDATALAAALRRLAADPELRDRLIAAGHETAARFTARAFNESLERELEHTVDGARPLRAA